MQQSKAMSWLIHPKGRCEIDALKKLSWKRLSKKGKRINQNIYKDSLNIK